ncbi:MAG TPA: phosphatase PAP2 family protein [Candidatus Acidoferrum sp.]
MSAKNEAIYSHKFRHSAFMNSKATKIALSALVLLTAAYLGASSRFYTEALISAYFALTLLGATIIHLRISPTWRDALLVVAGAFAFVAIDFRILHFAPAIAGWLSFAGLASLAIMGVESIWAQGESRNRHLLAFLPSVLFVVSEYFADNMLTWAATIHDKVYDLYLYSFDASLHIQIPFVLGQQFATNAVLRNTALIAYIGLSIPIAFVYAGQVRRVGAKALKCFAAFVVIGPVGILFYNFVPALGPAHLFGKNFPWNPLSLDQITRLLLQPVPIPGPRNAIPSLHMAWVLLAWWYSRKLSVWERAVAMFYLIFVGLATVGTGEHYFIDLVVAVPFALFIEALFAYELPPLNRKRLAGITFGLLSTLAWLAALRFTPHVFWFSPALPWTLCIITVALGLFFESRLQHQQPSTPARPASSGAFAPKQTSPATAFPESQNHEDAPVLAEIPHL